MLTRTKSTARFGSRALTTASVVLALGLATACSSPPQGGQVPAPTETSTPEDGVIDYRDFLTLVNAHEMLGDIEYERRESLQQATDKLGAVEDDWIMSAGQPEECFGAFASGRLVGVEETGSRADDYVMLIGLWEEYTPEDWTTGDVFVEGRAFDDSDAAAAFVAEVEAAAAACPTGYSFGGEIGPYEWASSGIAISELPGLPAAVTSRVLDELPAAGVAGARRLVLLQHDNAVIAIDVRATGDATFTPADVDPIVATLAERLTQL